MKKKRERSQNPSYMTSYLKQFVQHCPNVPISNVAFTCPIKHIIQSTKLCKKMFLSPKSQGKLYSIMFIILKGQMYLKSFLNI